MQTAIALSGTWRLTSWLNCLALTERLLVPFYLENNRARELRGHMALGFQGPGPGPNSFFCPTDFPSPSCTPHSSILFQGPPCSWCLPGEHLGSLTFSCCLPLSSHTSAHRPPSLRSLPGCLADVTQRCSPSVTHFISLHSTSETVLCCT